LAKSSWSSDLRGAGSARARATRGGAGAALEHVERHVAHGHRRVVRGGAAEALEDARAPAAAVVDVHAAPPVRRRAALLLARVLRLLAALLRAGAAARLGRRARRRRLFRRGLLLRLPLLDDVVETDVESAHGGARGGAGWLVEMLW